MRILVTNDDGIDSTGLHVLARSVAKHGDVVVAAPDSEYSGFGAAFGTLFRMQPTMSRARIDGVDEAWAVSGPPALCVMFARLGAFGEPFDLVVSGINPGANTGRAVYHSGTVGAALTARNGGISGIAVSQAVDTGGVEGQAWDEMLANQRWDTAGEVAAEVVGAMAAELPPEPVVLNLNVPNLPVAELAGWRRTEVASIPIRAMAGVELEPRLGHEDSFHVHMTWGEPNILPPDSDGGAVERGFVSVTWLSRLGPVDPPGAVVAETALDRIFAG